MSVTLDSRVDLVSLVRARWRTFACCAVAGSVVAAAYALLAPPWYEARLVVVPSQRTQSPGASLAASLPGIVGLASPLGTDVERISAVLTTNAVADAVIAKFGLMQLYGEEHIEDARTILWKHCSTKADKKAGVVTLVCEDKDPTRARDMAAYVGQVGNRVFGRISISSAGEERRFLEAQVAKARNDVADSSRKLREFQEQHKIIDIAEQSKAVISAMASVKADLVSKQLQLAYVAGFSAPTEGGVVQLRQQVEILRSKLAELEAAPAVADAARADHTVPAAAAAQASPDAAFFPKAMTVPELRFQIEPLIREQKVQEMVLLLLTQRYETARVDEARDTSTFQVLDDPTIPTIKSRPKRLLTVLLGLVGGLAGAYAWLAGPIYWRRRTASQ